MAAAFHLIALPVQNEESTLQAAMDALTDVEPGEAVFYSEAVAWTAEGSGTAFMRLVKAARQKHVNLVASLNIGGELAEDLPGRDPRHRYHALVVFTRHGHVHVPQAKCLPDAFERSGVPGDEAGGLSAYTRSNLIRLDMDEQLIEVRFVLGADLALLHDHGPAPQACDVLFSMARMPSEADERMREQLADARAAGLCSTTVQLNGIFARNTRESICKKVEEAKDNGRAITAKARWPHLARMQRRWQRYAMRKKSIDPSTAIERMNKDPKRAGRIPVLRAPRAKKVTLGVYPITIVL
jgi:hypothetical protein